MNSNDAKTRYNRVILKVNIFSKSSKKQPFSNLFTLIWNLSIDKKVVLMAVPESHMSSPRSQVGICIPPVTLDLPFSCEIVSVGWSHFSLRGRYLMFQNSWELGSPMVCTQLRVQQTSTCTQTGTLCSSRRKRCFLYPENMD